MPKTISKLSKKMKKVWLKLLKAEIKHKTNKVRKLELKLMELERQLRDEKHISD